MKINILIDYSRSMKETVFPSGKRKVDIVSEKLTSFLEKQENFKRPLCTFLPTR